MRHELANLLARGELRDPALAGANLTVTRVSVSPEFTKQHPQRMGAFFRYRVGAVLC